MTADVVSCRTTRLLIICENGFLAATQCFAQSVKIPRLSTWRIDMQEMAGDLWIGFRCLKVSFKLKRNTNNC